MLQHPIIHFQLYYWSSGGLQEVKNKRFQTFSSKSGCGHLTEVVACKVLNSDFTSMKLLVFWKTGHGGETFVAGGLSAIIIVSIIP